MSGALFNLIGALLLVAIASLFGVFAWKLSPRGSFDDRKFLMSAIALVLGLVALMLVSFAWVAYAETLP